MQCQEGGLDLSRFGRDFPMRWRQPPRPPGIYAASGNVAVTATLSFSPEGIGESMPLVATATLGATILSIESANVSATATLAAALTATLPTAGGILVTVTCSIASGSISIRLPSNQPGYQYVHDIPSNALVNFARMYEGVGVPDPNLGNNGDFFHRKDGVVGTNSLYSRASGAWTAIG
jgi:hypothetical protein